jgi:hypothetical protein
MDRAATEKALTEITSKHSFIWFVLWQDYYSDPEGVIFKWLQSHTIPIGPQKAFHGGIRVQGFLTKPPTVSAAAVPNPRSESFGGKIELVGYQFSQPKQGQSWPITLYLKALQPLDKDYTFFLHLQGPGNQGWTQRDDRPYSGGYRFPQWKPGEIVKVETSIEVPAFSPSVDYRLELGFYDPASSEVLKTKDSDRVVFEPIKLAPETVPFPKETTTCQYDFADQLSLRGYKVDVNGRESLTVITYWQALSEIRKDNLVSILLLDQNGQVVAQKQAAPGIKAYPTSAWPQNQTIVDFQWLQLPPNLQAGTYRLSIGIMDQQSAQMLQTKANLWDSLRNYQVIKSFELH